MTDQFSPISRRDVLSLGGAALAATADARTRSSTPRATVSKSAARSTSHTARATPSVTRSRSVLQSAKLHGISDGARAAGGASARARWQRNARVLRRRGGTIAKRRGRQPLRRKVGDGSRSRDVLSERCIISGWEGPCP